jgi:hypothetical protein
MILIDHFTPLTPRFPCPATLRLILLPPDESLEDRLLDHHRPAFCVHHRQLRAGHPADRGSGHALRASGLPDVPAPHRRLGEDRRSLRHPAAMVAVPARVGVRRPRHRYARRIRLSHVRGRLGGPRLAIARRADPHARLIRTAAEGLRDPDADGSSVVILFLHSHALQEALSQRPGRPPRNAAEAV